MAKNSSPKKRKFRRVVGRVLLWMFITSLVYVILCKWMMPPITLTQISDKIAGYGDERTYVSWNEISPNVKLAAMASEDQLFPDHHGFDWKALQKSMQSNPHKKNKVMFSGASTISQETAKNIFLWQGSGIMKYVRKIPEAYFTVLIELIWGKKRILEVYLNEIEMGKGIYGIEQASQTYFHKHAKDLTRTEAAMIIACLPNPKIYTVKPESKFVAWKTQWILRQMHNIEDDEDIMKLTR